MEWGCDLKTPGPPCACRRPVDIVENKTKRNAYALPFLKNKNKFCAEDWEELAPGSWGRFCGASFRLQVTDSLRWRSRSPRRGSRRPPTVWFWGVLVCSSREELQEVGALETLPMIFMKMRDDYSDTTPVEAHNLDDRYKAAQPNTEEGPPHDEELFPIPIRTHKTQIPKRRQVFPNVGTTSISTKTLEKQPPPEDPESASLAHRRGRRSRCRRFERPPVGPHRRCTHTPS